MHDSHCKIDKLKLTEGFINLERQKKWHWLRQRH